MNFKFFVFVLVLVVLVSLVVVEIYFGCCKMGECLYYDQSGCWVEVQGLVWVLGQLVWVVLCEVVFDWFDMLRKCL